MEDYDEISPPSLMTSNADGQKCDGKIWQVLRGLNKLVTSLSQKQKTLKILDSYQKSNSLPTIIAVSDPPAVQRALRARQTININHESPLQAGFQFFPVIEQRDTQVNILRVPTPILFKLLK